jgi:NAD(P)-dependent dehydrogenase (short-subunit alcohol dehydrogenase family)
VTGSTSGIGLGIAKALAEQGANVVFNGFGDAANQVRGSVAAATSREDFAAFIRARGPGARRR